MVDLSMFTIVQYSVKENDKIVSYLYGVSLKITLKIYICDDFIHR